VGGGLQEKYRKEEKRRIRIKGFYRKGGDGNNSDGL
jgi:hypothetical protein